MFYLHFSPGMSDPLYDSVLMGSAQTQTEEEMLSNYSNQRYIVCIFLSTPSRKLLLTLGNTCMKVVHELYKY